MCVKTKIPPSAINFAEGGVVIILFTVEIVDKNIAAKSLRHGSCDTTIICTISNGEKY